MAGMYDLGRKKGGFVLLRNHAWRLNAGKGSWSGAFGGLAVMHRWDQ